MILSENNFQNFQKVKRDLREEEFEKVKINDTELNHASFHWADFYYCEFKNIKSYFSDYTNTTFIGCTFENCKFSRDTPHLQLQHLAS